jgi:hypothetical protein
MPTGLNAMTNFLPRLLQHHSSIQTQLTVDAFPEARQGSFSFYAVGDLPMRALTFVFCAPDGSVVARVAPRRTAPRPAPRAWRWRATWPVQLIEFAARLLLGRNNVYRVELTPEQLRHPGLSVRIENLGAASLVIGHLCLRTTTLAPDRRLRNEHPIEGYSERVSVAAGAVLPLYVHAPAGEFALRVVRFGAREQTLFRVSGLRGMAQDYLASAYQDGAGWQPSYHLKTGAGWPSGLYAACISDPDGVSFDITFIVTNPALPAPGRIAVLASTNTWQAYNDWGGASLYRYDQDDGLGRTHAFAVHQQRPNPAASPRGAIGHLANAERHVLSWLEQHKIDYDLLADADLNERPGLLDHYTTLLLNTHSEYWSAAMYTALEAFMQRGGNLIYLSANGLYWKTVMRQGRLEVQSDHSCHPGSNEAGGRWRDLGRPEWRILGTQFTRAGYRSHFRPYKVITAGHWVFEQTGVVAGDLVGASGLNCGGASGWELDKLDPTLRPLGLVHLAKGTNPGRHGADMVYFTHPGGGGVFSAGSITFGGSLAVDPVLSRMLLNVTARFARTLPFNIPMPAPRPVQPRPATADERP